MSSVDTKGIECYRVGGSIERQTHALFGFSLFVGFIDNKKNAKLIL